MPHVQRDIPAVPIWFLSQDVVFTLTWLDDSNRPLRVNSHELRPSTATLHGNGNRIQNFSIEIHESHVTVPATNSTGVNTTINKGERQHINGQILLQPPQGYMMYSDPSVNDRLWYKRKADYIFHASNDAAIAWSHPSTHSAGIYRLQTGRYEGCITILRLKRSAHAHIVTGRLINTLTHSSMPTRFQVAASITAQISDFEAPSVAHWVLCELSAQEHQALDANRHF